MADYFTHFSTILDTGDPAKAIRIVDLYTRLAAADLESDDDPVCHGFDVLLADGPLNSLLWIRSEESGDVEAAIAFVLGCAEELDLTGRWGFTYALTCSRPRIDAFGGGGVVLDLGTRTTVVWLDAAHWLRTALNRPHLDV